MRLSRFQNVGEYLEPSGSNHHIGGELSIECHELRITTFESH